MYKILIVDDVPENLKVIIGIITKSHPNYTIYQAKDAIKGFQIAQKMLPDLIITDWDMPVVSGLEFVKQLKSTCITKTIPVVMATGVMLTPENLSLALEAGCIDYIRKPFDPIELEARIHSAIELVDNHQTHIDYKNQQLAQNTLSVAESRRFMTDMVKKLSCFLSEASLCHSERETLQAIVGEMETKANLLSWKRFDEAFQLAHPNFNKNLIAKFKDLTPSELKLSNLIRMGLSIKDIANALFMSPESVKVSRSRLRKKFELETSENLKVFLEKF